MIEQEKGDNGFCRINEISRLFVSTLRDISIQALLREDIVKKNTTTTTTTSTYKLLCGQQARARAKYFDPRTSVLLIRFYDFIFGLLFLGRFDLRRAEDQLSYG